MSPINPIVLQRRMRTLGRIRIGQQVAYEKGGRTKYRPAKLETFRLTSRSRELIAAAAEALGGEVRPWQNGDHPEWEVVTHASALDIVIAPGEPVTQHMEMWAAGGCVRRCDGVTMTNGAPCLCPRDPQERRDLAAQGEACKPTTRLTVLLPQLPDLGVWLLSSGGFYAAVELAGAADFLTQASEAGVFIPARLRLEQRKVKRPGQPEHEFAVPVIEFTQTRMADLALPAPGESGTAGRLGGRPAVPALPATTLPATSDFRAPVPEVEQDDGVLTPVTAGPPSSEPDRVTPPAQPLAPGLCGAQGLHEEERCGLQAGHKPPHRSLGKGGIVTGTW